jgi:hypothetical protein
VARAFIAAAGSFSKALGGDLGHYAAKRVTNWLEQLRTVRERKVTIVVQTRRSARRSSSRVTSRRKPSTV